MCAGDGADYISVSILEGAVSVSINLGSGVFEDEVKPKRRFDDNRWHHILINRDAREVGTLLEICIC